MTIIPKKFGKMLTFTGVAFFLAAGVPAMAATSPANSVKDMPNGEDVTVSGTVENFDARHPFTLRDSSGTVSVDLTTARPIVLKNGQKVTVTGIVDKGLLETDVSATDVVLDSETNGDTSSIVNEIKGQTPSSSPQTVQIKSIPETGFVKIAGTVDSVDGGKTFTLKDATGSVNVNIQTDKSLTLKQGQSVTIVGYLDRENIGRTINATDVKTTSGSPSIASE